MRHVRFIVAFLAVCICGDIIPGLSRISQSYQAKDAQGPQPLWEIDLSKFGYEARLKELPDKTYPHPVSWGTRQTLVFTQENVLATTFEVHIEDGAPSVRDKNLPTDPYHMAVLFLTAGSGAVIRKGDWPVHSSTRTWFFAAQDGQSILGIGNKLTLLSPELTKISELTLPTPYGELTMALASPAADTLLVLYGGGPEFKYASKLDLLDTADLSLLKFWTGEEARPKWALWGNELARFSDHDIRIETTTSGPREVLASEDLNCGFQSFINQETLAVGKFGKDGCNTLALVSTGGKIIQEVHFDAKGIFGTARASRNGRFFAIDGAASQRAPSKPFVKVFKFGSEKPLLTVDFPATVGGAGYAMDIPGLPFGDSAKEALSPEGDLLAIRTGPIVRVYRVPKEVQ